MSRAEPHAEALITRACARLRAGVLAVVFGAVGGTGLLLLTAWLVVRGGPNVGQHLGLLAHYFPGYTVTWGGAVLGFGYGALTGGVVGGLLALLYNRLAAWRQRS